MDMEKDILDVIASLEPSRPVYKIRESWGNSIAFQKADRISCDSESFLKEVVLRHASEVLDLDLKRHMLYDMNIHSVKRSCFDHCHDLCVDFLDKYLPNKAPRQSSIYKFFYRSNFNHVFNSDKYRDSFYHLAKFITENKFENKKDPKAAAIIDALGKLKTKFVDELKMNDKPERGYYGR